MSLIRAFLSFEISLPLQKNIAEHITIIKKALGNSVRWVATENIHMTLKFLGNTSPASLQNLTHALNAVIAQQQSFDISIGGFGVFPNLKRPRILWIGIQAPPDLERLYRVIETTCTRLGYPPEIKPLNPHLTIGRLRDDADLSALRPALKEVEIEPLGSMTVSSITLFRSDLRPQGPIYTPLTHLPLANLISQPKRGEP